MNSPAWCDRLGRPVSRTRVAAAASRWRDAFNMVIVYGAAAVCLLVSSGAMAQTTQLLISNDFCLLGPCPIDTTPPTTTRSGVPFFIYVAARDAQNTRVVDYAGRVAFSSTDPLATLPSNYTFLATDMGGRRFTVILRTPGDQTITVSDTLNGVTGSFVMTVTGQLKVATVPALSTGAILLLLLALGCSGVWLLRLRS